jgi:hypothetical protein
MNSLNFFSDVQGNRRLLWPTNLRHYDFLPDGRIPSIKKLLSELAMEEIAVEHRLIRVIVTTLPQRF